MKLSFFQLLELAKIDIEYKIVLSLKFYYFLR